MATTGGGPAVTTTEGVLRAGDGRALYTKAWEPARQSARAVLVWLHGFGDHCNTFGPLFEALASQGIAVQALDQRGWGRSVAQATDRGATGPTSTVLADISAAVAQAVATTTDLPLFLGGHSMGGAEALLWAARGPAKSRVAVRGYVVAAPFLRFHADVAPPRVVVWLARALACCFPDWQLVHRPRLEDICRDVDVQGDVAGDDALLHGMGTLRGVVDMIRRGDELAAGLHDLPPDDDDDGDDRGRAAAVSLWIGQGDADRIVCPDAVAAYFARSPVRDKHLRVYEGCFHDLHREPGRHKVDFANDVAAWISERA